MADLTVTADKVSVADPQNAIINDYIAAVTITAGQGVYINSDGKAALADASAAGTAVCIGVALEGAGAGQVVPVCSVGYVDGLGVSAVAYSTIISVSDTAGAFDNGAGSPSVAAPIGRVMPATDGSLTKLVLVNCYYNLNVLPA
jgi:predicted transcriptional regulator